MFKILNLVSINNNINEYDSTWCGLCLVCVWKNTMKLGAASGLVQRCIIEMTPSLRIVLGQ